MTEKKISYKSTKAELEEFAREAQAHFKPRLEASTEVVLSFLPSSESVGTVLIVQNVGDEDEGQTVVVSTPTPPARVELNQMWERFDKEPYVPFTDRFAIERAAAKVAYTPELTRPTGIGATQFYLPSSYARKAMDCVYLAHVWRFLHEQIKEGNGKAELSLTGANRSAVTGLPETPTIIQGVGGKTVEEALHVVSDMLSQNGVTTSSGYVASNFSLRMKGADNG